MMFSPKHTPYIYRFSCNRSHCCLAMLGMYAPMRGDGLREFATHDGQRGCAISPRVPPPSVTMPNDLRGSPRLRLPAVISVPEGSARSTHSSRRSPMLPCVHDAQPLHMANDTTRLLPMCSARISSVAQRGGSLLGVVDASNRHHQHVLRRVQDAVRQHKQHLKAAAMVREQLEPQQHHAPPHRSSEHLHRQRTHAVPQGARIGGQEVNWTAERVLREKLATKAGLHEPSVAVPSKSTRLEQKIAARRELVACREVAYAKAMALLPQPPPEAERALPPVLTSPRRAKVRSPAPHQEKWRIPEPQSVWDFHLEDFIAPDWDAAHNNKGSAAEAAAATRLQAASRGAAARAKAAEMRELRRLAIAGGIMDTV